MWQKSENSEPIQPLEVEFSESGIVIVRKDFEFIEATEDFPEHWEWNEWQMSEDQYSVWLAQQADVDYLMMENEILAEENEQQQADIDFCLMLLED